MPKEEAMKLGAMALFGEKYGDIVRVVIIDPTYSIELCGGTHVGSTGELGFFKFTHETAVAAGVRRVEAVCGKMAENYLNEQFATIREVRESLKSPKDISKSISHIINENTELKKRIEKLEAGQLEIQKKELLKKAIQLNGTTFIGEVVEASSADALKKLCFDLRSELKNYAVVLASNIDEKAQVVVMIDEKTWKHQKLLKNRLLH
jgi:alanyl-tRNA synthetase